MPTIVASQDSTGGGGGGGANVVGGGAILVDGGAAEVVGLGDRVVGNVGSVGNCEVGVAISVGPESWLRAKINAPIINIAAIAMLATTSTTPRRLPPMSTFVATFGGWSARGSGAVCQARPSQ